MVYFKDPQEWSRQSILLLQARPTTTRITTKYKLLPPPSSLSSSKPSKPRKAKPSSHSTKVDAQPATELSHPPPQPQPPPPPPRAFLVLKTYDPVSGVCLKHRTAKAADVGRLIAGLGRCGRVMAAVPVGEEKGGGVEGAGAEEGPVGGGDAGGGVKDGGVPPAPAGRKEGGGKEAGKEGGKGKAGGGGGGGGKKKKGKK